MTNILNYINYFTNIFFGMDLLVSPSDTISSLSDIAAETFALERPLTAFITDLFSSPVTIFSTVVWVLFSIFTIYLLLILPFRFVRSVVRKCRVL